MKEVAELLLHNRLLAGKLTTAGGFQSTIAKNSTSLDAVETGVQT